MQIIEVVFIVCMLAVLTIQAYLDLKTMKLYYWLTIAAIITGAVPCIFYTVLSDITYIVICLAMIFGQYIIHAYNIGDAKLCVLVLEIIIMRAEGMDIMIRYFMYNVTAMAIFLLFAVFKRITDKEKKKKYPYAPAILLAVCSSLLY